jgi:hypothetical protein
MRHTILALLTLLAACASTQPKPSEAPAGIDLEVTVLEPGAEPRQQIRYHGSSGRTERLLLRLSLANFIQTQAGSAGGASPVLDLVMHVGATYRGSEGSGLWGYPLKFEMIGVNGADGLEPAALDALAAELEPIARTRGIFEIDNRGITRSAELTIPPEASPRLLTMLGNVRTTLLAAALPKEAVGVGARWQAERIVKVGGMKVPQTVTYTLVERDGDVLHLGISARQSAVPQEFPHGIDGSVIKLQAYEMTAVGNSVVDLHGFAPMSELHATSEMRASLHRGALVEPIAMSGDLTIVIAPLPEGALKAQQEAAPPPPAADPVAPPG